MWWWHAQELSENHLRSVVWHSALTLKAKFKIETYDLCVTCIYSIESAIIWFNRASVNKKLLKSTKNCSYQSFRLNQIYLSLSAQLQNCTIGALCLIVDNSKFNDLREQEYCSDTLRIHFVCLNKLCMYAQKQLFHLKYLASWIHFCVPSLNNHSLLLFHLCANNSALCFPSESKTICIQNAIAKSVDSIHCNHCNLIQLSKSVRCTFVAFDHNHKRNDHKTSQLLALNICKSNTIYVRILISNSAKTFMQTLHQCNFFSRTLLRLHSSDVMGNILDLCRWSLLAINHCFEFKLQFKRCKSAVKALFSSACNWILNSFSAIARYRFQCHDRRFQAFIPNVIRSLQT